ncbi:sirohydrochlorin chelatase, partial [Ancylomarina sp. 16SWW S1-10-2]|uniref:sirohydrochlorin chelatase n=1 Tax=Ancylomarina sp. 16SWW S1-10-2 TaxID=2499681 RepID=UPI001DDA20EC
TCLDLGYQQFDLYPLFFNRGNHVTRDIPAQIAQTQEQHKGCVIRQLDYFGKFEQLGNSVVEHIQEQVDT